nr:hypothetical protein [Tanacetum cinerariifolium]
MNLMLRWMTLIDDDEVPSEEVSPELLKEISREVDEAQLKQDLSLQILVKPALVYLSYETDPKAPPMTLLNQDLFYLKYDNSGPKKYVLSLHKYLIVPLPENDLKELTSRWVSKLFKRFNLYARYSVEHKKNLWTKQHYIRRQEKKGDNPNEVYSESKIVEVVRTLYDLGYEHKYITEIVVRRADGKFGAFLKSDYKYLYKNDKLLNIDYTYQQKVNLTVPTITFPGIERKKLLTTTSKPVVGLIYENNKKEKSVMEIKEMPKFYDATLIRVLKLVEKNNMDKV